jgi:hypothetical protein
MLALHAQGVSMSDYYHDDPNVSDAVAALMLSSSNPWANPQHPPASIKDIVATIEKLFGKSAAAGVRISVN